MVVDARARVVCDLPARLGLKRRRGGTRAMLHSSDNSRKF